MMMMMIMWTLPWLALVLCLFPFSQSLFLYKSSQIASKLSFTRIHSLDHKSTPLLDVQDDLQPKIALKSIEDESSQAKTNNAWIIDSSKQLSSDSAPKTRNKIFGDISIEELGGKAERKIKASEQKKEDLNGINPLTPLSFSLVPAGLSLGGWKLTVYLAGHLAVQYLNSDIYPLQRASIVIRNIVIGLTTLATGFSGVIALGLFLLGIRVAFGVLSGELDMNAKTNDSQNADNSLLT
jgi:hypothetical protein